MASRLRLGIVVILWPRSQRCGVRVWGVPCAAVRTAGVEPCSLGQTETALFLRRYTCVMPSDNVSETYSCIDSRSEEGYFFSCSTNKQHTHMITEVWGMQWDMPQLHSRTPTIPLLSTGRSRVRPVLSFGLKAALFRVCMDLGCVTLRLCLPPCAPGFADAVSYAAASLPNPGMSSRLSQLAQETQDNS